jgi:hypothetical protein
MIGCIDLKHGRGSEGYYSENNAERLAREPVE